MKILVLYGGESAEREVSLDSGTAIAKSLKAIGHEVELIDVGSGRKHLEFFSVGRLAGNHSSGSLSPIDAGEPEKADRNTEDMSIKCDCVFIALHGGTGEDGTLQALLELAGVKYTGSGMAASALAMDKYRSKLLFNAVDIPTPKTLYFGTIEGALSFCDNIATENFNFPIVVKPNAQGSTIGLSIVNTPDLLKKAVNEAANYDRDILIEEFIAGRELTVAILGDQALPVVEIVPHSGFYDYTAKYTPGKTDYLCPAKLEKQVEQKIMSYALRAFSLIGCSGFGRVDFRLSTGDELYCLEVNTIPGMTATSLVPKAAKTAGIDFEKLLQRIVDLALENH